jgi:hypothetical protein
MFIDEHSAWWELLHLASPAVITVFGAIIATWQKKNAANQAERDANLNLRFNHLEKTLTDSREEIADFRNEYHQGHLALIARVDKHAEQIGELRGTVYGSKLGEQ